MHYSPFLARTVCRINITVAVVCALEGKTGIQEKKKKQDSLPSPNNNELDAQIFLLLLLSFSFFSSSSDQHRISAKKHLGNEEEEPLSCDQMPPLPFPYQAAILLSPHPHPKRSGDYQVKGGGRRRRRRCHVLMDMAKRKRAERWQLHK